MKKDAHYYGILAMARGCGFTKSSAHQIAYASQYVDDAKVNHYILSGPVEGIECLEIINDKPSLFNVATSHDYTKINTYNYSAMINNTVAFHFVPECNGKSFARKLQCGENSPVIKAVLTEAIEFDDPVRFGLVLHPYADTFAHAGFSGLLSKVNDIRDVQIPLFSLPVNFFRFPVNLIKKLNHRLLDRWVDRLLPAYGHAQAWTYPDISHLNWKYKYDYTDDFSQRYKTLPVDNKDRYKRAFQNIKIWMDKFLDKHPSHKDNDIHFEKFDELSEIITMFSYGKRRIGKLQRFMIDNELFEYADYKILEYDKNLWQSDAFLYFYDKHFDKRKVENVKVKDTFVKSNLYNFFIATKWYKKQFHHHCAQNDLHISM